MKFRPFSFLLAGLLGFGLGACSDDDAGASAGSLALQITASEAVQAAVTSLTVAIDGGAAAPLDIEVPTGTPAEDTDEAASEDTTTTEGADDVTAAPAFLPASALRGLLAAATLGNLSPGQRTITVAGFAGDASEPVASASARVNITAGGVALLALELSVGEPPVVSGISASEATIRNHSPVDFSAVVTATEGVASEYAWSDDCGGAFTDATAPTSAWETWAPGNCNISVTVTQDGQSDSFTLPVAVGMRPGTAERIAGEYCTTAGKAGWYDDISPLVGENGPAIDARFSSVRGLAFAPNGDLWFTDREAGRVLRIEKNTGILRRVAGPAAGSADTSGLGGPATAATLYWPTYLTFSNEGTAYVVLTFGRHTVAIDPADGLVTVLTGSGNWGNGTDGGTALHDYTYPQGIAVMPDGRFFVSDRNGGWLYRYYPAAGTVEVFLTNLAPSSDSNKHVEGIFGLATDANGHLIAAERGTHSIVRYNTQTKARTVLAGTGTAGDGASGGVTDAVALHQPFGVTVLSGNRVAFTDTFNHKLRVIDTNGVVTTVAGPNQTVILGKAEAPERVFEYPTDVAVDSAGNLYFGEKNNCRVWKLHGPF